MATHKSTTAHARTQRPQLPHFNCRDYTGQRFGNIVALRFSHIEKGKACWWCRCDCGGEKLLQMSQATQRPNKQCRCPRDLTGKRVGRLVVMSRAPYPAGVRTGVKGRRWHCHCDCGKDVIVPQRGLVVGTTTSCGCYRREVSSRVATERNLRRRTHGRTNTPEFRAWASIRSRCGDPFNANYHRYGGRGITISAEWDTFEQFFADMGERPSPRHSIGRKDNDGPYAKFNCRWETAKQQGRNTRANRVLTVDGVSMCMIEWAERIGITATKLHSRLEYGWPLDLAVSTPSGVRLSDLNVPRLPVDPLVRAKRYARAWVRHAVIAGRLLRPDRCTVEGCTRTDIQGHHHNGYAREHWLDVVWLCRPHHEEAEKRDNPRKLLPAQPPAS